MGHDGSPEAITERQVTKPGKNRWPKRKSRVASCHNLENLFSLYRRVRCPSFTWQRSPPFLPGFATGLENQS